MDIRITNPAGKVATIEYTDPRLQQALANVFQAGLSEQHTARAIEANNQLWMCHPVEHKGWKFEPITDAEVA